MGWQTFGSAIDLNLGIHSIIFLRRGVDPQNKREQMISNCQQVHHLGPKVRTLFRNSGGWSCATQERTASFTLVHNKPKCVFDHLRFPQATRKQARLSHDTDQPA